MQAMNRCFDPVASTRGGHMTQTVDSRVGVQTLIDDYDASARSSSSAVAPQVVGNESGRVIVSDAAAARQPASSSRLVVPTSFVLPSSLSVW
jgi:hypothetical protein